MLDVLTSLDLAKVVVGRIRMNLVWALGYNVVCIPFAAGLLFPFIHCTLPPQLAGAAMAMSSVSVVCSSLSLKWYRKPLLCRQHDEQKRLEKDSLSLSSGVAGKSRGRGMRIRSTNKRQSPAKKSRKKVKYAALGKVDDAEEDAYADSSDDDVEMVGSFV